MVSCALEIITADYRALILNEGTINVLTFVAVTAVVICSWILILAFLVDVSRSQENDKLEDVLQEDALPVDEERPPRDTDAASSKRRSIYYVET